MRTESKALARLAGLQAAMLLACCALLAGCSQSGVPTVAGPVGSKQAHGGPDDPADHDMVSAFSPAGATPPIGMKFRLESKPVVGQPVQVTVELIPAATAAISGITVSLLAGDGLQLQSDRSFDVEDPRSTFRQVVTLTPQQAGVLNLSATVIVELDTGSLARTYSIPLIAANSPS